MKACLKKEWMEMLRTGRLWILLLVFGLFGIMNPALAKLTPWLMEIMSDSLEGAGILVQEVTISALDSWMQFYKNIPMALIIFVLLSSGILTSEYQKGTLIPIVTKGLSRRKIILSKTVNIYSAWTICYVICYGITYMYNAYFWDNTVASYPLFAAGCYWLFGMWVLSFMILFSALFDSDIQVLAGTGGVALAVYLFGFISEISGYIPSKLMNGMTVLQGISRPSDYVICIAVTAIVAVMSIVAAALCFDRRQL